MNDQRKRGVRPAPRVHGHATTCRTRSPAMREEVIEKLVALRIPEKLLRRAVGIRGTRGRCPGACSASTCRSPSGRARTGWMPTRWPPRVDQAVVGAAWPRRPRIMAPRSCASSRSRSFSPRSMRVWKEHLLALDQLRQGIYLRAHGQRDPLNEYKREALRAVQRDARRTSRARLVDAGACRGLHAARAAAGAGRARARRPRCSWRRPMPRCRTATARCSRRRRSILADPRDLALDAAQRALPVRGRGGSIQALSWGGTYERVFFLERKNQRTSIRWNTDVRRR